MGIKNQIASQKEIDDFLKQIGKEPPKKERPKSEPVTAKKEVVTIRLDADIVAHFKKDGRFWQTRVNDFLRKALP